MYQQTHQELVKQLCRHRSNQLLQRCVAAIEDLTQELEREVKINEEQKQLIRIIQEGKQYYESQCKNNPYEQKCHQLTAEVAHLNHTVKTQHNVNQQLQERAHYLQEMLRVKDREVEQLNEEIRDYMQAMEAMRLQKEILEKEWNKAVKAVKRKIEKIVSQDNPEAKHITISKKYELPLQTRESQRSDDSQRRADLRTRAQTMLLNIQKTEAIQQFQCIFLQPSSNKKQAQSLSSSQQQRRALREISQNIHEC